jgi:NitT/TauT family transport system permease protein
MVAPFGLANPNPISLSQFALPMYAVRTTLRMITALITSLIFTLLYATTAAKSRRAEIVLIPILDVLQSVPVLGYLSFTVLFFVSLFPGNILGPELAAIFGIFTSQAWNMTFSFYQSLRMIPAGLDKVSRSFQSVGLAALLDSRSSHAPRHLSLLCHWGHHCFGWRVERKCSLGSG